MDLICRDKPLVAAVFAYPVRTKMCSQFTSIIALYSSLKKQIVESALFAGKRFGCCSVIAYCKKHIEIDVTGNASYRSEGRKIHHDNKTSPKKMQEHDCSLQVILSRLGYPEIIAKDKADVVCCEKFANIMPFYQFFRLSSCGIEFCSINDDFPLLNRSI